MNPSPSSVPCGWDCHVHVFDPAHPAQAGHYRPVLRDIPSDLSRRATAMLLNYPNNPTGAVATTVFLVLRLPAAPARSASQCRARS